MSDYISSLLLAFQSKIAKDYNSAELRELQNPILRQALGYADFIIGDVEAVKASDKRAVYTYFKNRIASTNGTARSYQPTGAQGNSGQVTLGWVTFSETSGLFRQTGADNVFNNPEMLQYQIGELQRNLRERIGTYIVQQLHTNRTQTSPSVVTSTRNMNWNGANFAFENTADQNSFIFENAASVMRQNKYYDKFDVVADPVAFKQARFSMFQGQGNMQNLTYQFGSYNPEGIMEHSVLGTSVAEPYANGCIIVCPKASFAVIPWIPLINRDGYGDYEDFNGGFGWVPDNTGLPLKYAFRGWTQKADGSANGSVHQDVQFNFELSVDIDFQAAPISNSGETAIYEFGQL